MSAYLLYSNFSGALLIFNHRILHYIINIELCGEPKPKICVGIHQLKGFLPIDPLLLPNDYLLKCIIFKAHIQTDSLECLV